jgi:hypothetical protein
MAAKRWKAMGLGDVMSDAATITTTLTIAKITKQ